MVGITVGQKEKEIKAMAIGLLTQKFMYDVLYDIEQVEDKDPKKTAWLRDNMRLMVLNKLNLAIDFLDKRRMTEDEYDSLNKATALAQMGYNAYEKAREMKRKEKEQRKIAGVEQ